MNPLLGPSAEAFVWWIPFVAYLLGSVPFGYLIVRLRGGGDLRVQGSGNIGATNVTRVAGAAAGLVTLLLDAAKGYLAVWLAARASSGNVRWIMLAALLVIAGHLFPVWLGFRGGRGVATGVGAFLPVCAPAVLGALVVWIVVFAFWRYVSLASISAAAALPALVYQLYAPPYAPPAVVSAATVAAAALVILRHRPNISRLLQGTEPQIVFHRTRNRPGA